MSLLDIASVLLDYVQKEGIPKSFGSGSKYFASGPRLGEKVESEKRSITEKIIEFAT